MKGSKWWLLAALPLALAACGANDTEGEEDDPTDGAGADTAATAAAPMPMPGDTGMAHGTGPMMVPMQPVGGSSVSGEATLTEQGTQTQVAVRLTGFQPSSAHSGHVHQGTCEAPGSPVAPLQDLAADASGSGTATSTVAIPSATLMNGQHIVAYHQGAGENMGPPVVCGAIQGHAM